MKKLRVIVIDDEMLIRKLIRMKIDTKRLNLEIVGEYANGMTALKSLEETKPDIVISDICMPEADGLLFSEECVKRFPEIKIILVTGYDDFEYARRSIKAGVFDYILKPVQEEELNASLQRAANEILKICSEKEKQPTPTDVTKQFLTAIQKQDETALKTSSQWNLASMKSLQMQDEDYIDGIDHELQKAAHDTMYGFQFTIKKETIKDKNAQVAIILKTKDIRNAVKKGMKEAEKKVEKLSKDKNFSDQKAQQEILTTLYTYIRDSKEEKEQTVTISLQQNDGVWIVKKENQELEKALLANGEELIQLIQ